MYSTQVLITSSISAGAADALGDLQCEAEWSAHRAYALSKLCCAMVAMELHARYGDPPRLCANTMDPGTVNTKMLEAGWGRCGIPVSSATRSYAMLVDPEWGETSGECAGTCAPRESGDAGARERLWADLAALTGATWPRSLRCEPYAAVIGRGGEQEGREDQRGSRERGEEPRGRPRPRLDAAGEVGERHRDARRVPGAPGARDRGVRDARRDRPESFLERVGARGRASLGRPRGRRVRRGVLRPGDRRADRGLGGGPRAVRGRRGAGEIAQLGGRGLRPARRGRGRGRVRLGRGPSRGVAGDRRERDVALALDGARVALDAPPGLDRVREPAARRLEVAAEVRPLLAEAAVDVRRGGPLAVEGRARAVRVRGRGRRGAEGRVPLRLRGIPTDSSPDTAQRECSGTIFGGFLSSRRETTGSRGPTGPKKPRETSSI